MTADATYANNNLSALKIRGGYNGTAVQGSPRLDWEANITYAYDTNDRLTKEELALTSMTKTYTERPYGAERQEIGTLYQDMRVRKPVEHMLSTGDRCGISGTQVLGNPVDLRPFYALTPNLAIVLGNGVTRASVSFTYPDSYRVR
ncbi:MAG TPA: hypothetical protein VNN25_27380, partial [Thermoanaerobaculia bacterium]|nr:hypothetical protein [Thermoanaerobaculia bacterium]